MNRILTRRAALLGVSAATAAAAGSRAFAEPAPVTVVNVMPLGVFAMSPIVSPREIS